MKSEDYGDNIIRFKETLEKALQKIKDKKDEEFEEVHEIIDQEATCFKISDMLQRFVKKYNKLKLQCEEL